MFQAVRDVVVFQAERNVSVLHSGIIFHVIVVYSGISRRNLVLTFGDV